MTSKQTATLVSAIIAFLLSATQAVNLYIKNHRQEEQIREHLITEGKQASTLNEQAKSINDLIQRGLTPAGTFDDGLMASLTSFLDEQVNRHPARISIIADSVMYGCISHPAEYDHITAKIKDLIKGSRQDKTDVRMMVYSEAMNAKVVNLQLSEETWQNKVVGKKTDLSLALANWINRPDVREALRSAPVEPAKMLAFKNGDYGADDRKDFLSCIQMYNKARQRELAAAGVKLVTTDDPLPFHLWLADKSDNDDRITGVISIADWISSIDEPGFAIRKTTHLQFNAIAEQLFDHGVRLASVN